MTQPFDTSLTDEEKDTLRTQVSGLSRRPGLAVVSLNELPVWVGQDCAVCGIYCERYALHLGVGREDLLELLEGLSLRPDLDGVLVWPPLPQGRDEEMIPTAAVPEKTLAAPTWAQALELTVARAEKRK